MARKKTPDNQFSDRSNQKFHPIMLNNHGFILCKKEILLTTKSDLHYD